MLAVFRRRLVGCFLVGCFPVLSFTYGALRCVWHLNKKLLFLFWPLDVVEWIQSCHSVRCVTERS